MPNKRASHSAVLKHKRGDDRELHISHIPESPPLHASSPPVCPNEGSIGRVQEHTIASTIAEVTQLATTHTTADSSPMLSPGSDPEKRGAQKGVVGKHCLVSQTASAQILGGRMSRAEAEGKVGGAGLSLPIFGALADAGARFFYRIPVYAPECIFQVF